MSDRVRGGLPVVCGLCKAEIYDNVDGDKIECGMCVQRRVKHIERLERESGIVINNRYDYAAARNRADGGSNRESAAKEIGCKTLSATPTPCITDAINVNLKPINRKELPLRWSDLL